LNVCVTAFVKCYLVCTNVTSPATGCIFRYNYIPYDLVKALVLFTGVKRINVLHGMQ